MVKDARYRRTRLTIGILRLAFSTAASNFDVGAVKYFSAYPKTNVPRRKRHETFVANLQAAGVTVIMGEHKKVWRKCQATCKETYETYEEKETDVRIALEIMNDAHAGRFDRAERGLRFGTGRRNSPS